MTHLGFLQLRDAMGVVEVAVTGNPEKGPALTPIWERSLSLPPPHAAQLPPNPASPLPQDPAKEDLCSLPHTLGS